MKLFPGIFQKRQKESPHTLQAVQEKFSNFLAILENNNLVLKNISDMEEKSGGEYLFDINYIRSSLVEVRKGVLGIAEGMIALGGEKYSPLLDSYQAINEQISRIFPENRPAEKDDFAIPLEKVGREKTWSVGSKSAQLGEMKSKLSLPVPEGFAVSAWAYKHFVDTNDLHHRMALVMLVLGKQGTYFWKKPKKQSFRIFIADLTTKNKAAVSKSDRQMLAYLFCQTNGGYPGIKATKSTRAAPFMTKIKNCTKVTPQQALPGIRALTKHWEAKQKGAR